MKSERWQRVEHLYHAALHRDAADRTAFLSDACAGDPSLRREVESLLEYGDNADHFLEALAVQAAAMMVATGERPSLVGRPLGSYQVLSRISAGGMGGVYRARDIRLDRDVAVSVLPDLIPPRSRSPGPAEILRLRP